MKMLRKARYRFEQASIFKIGTNILDNTNTRGQYLFEIYNNEVKSQWEETHYDFKQKYPDGEDFISLSDKIRGKVDFNINDKGDITEILNFDELQQRWEEAKLNEIPNSVFIKKLRISEQADTYPKIIEMNDLEFADMENFKRAMNNYLYYRVVLGQYLLTSYVCFQTEYQTIPSLFFPNLSFGITTTYETTEITDEFFIVRYSSCLDKSTFDVFEMIHAYNEKYKAMVGYNFSEFDYKLQATLYLSKEDKLIENAVVTIDEGIKNNLSSHVEFQLNRVEL